MYKIYAADDLSLLPLHTDQSRRTHYTELKASYTRQIKRELRGIHKGVGVMRERDLEAIGASSMIRFIRSGVALTSMLSALDLSSEVVTGK